LAVPLGDISVIPQAWKKWMPRSVYFWIRAGGASAPPQRMRSTELRSYSPEEKTSFICTQKVGIPARTVGRVFSMSDAAAGGLVSAPAKTSEAGPGRRRRGVPSS
jgi:hypothetical protein